MPPSFPTGGKLSPGDLLVSNFNNAANQQGTGTTIVAITPDGGESIFFQGASTPGQLGLTTALGVLQRGFVIVGSVPATYDSHGNLVSVGQGSLLILDRSGNVVSTISDSSLLGPTGLAYDARRDILYVASTGDNAIFAIRDARSRTTDAGTGRVVYRDSAHLRGPLGLVLAPNGDLIASNGDAVNANANQPSELVEFTPRGRFVGQFSIDPTQGAAFGLAVSDVGGVLRLAAVEDVTNSVDIWTFDSNSRDSFGSNRGRASGSAALDANFVTTIGLPSGSQSGTPIASVLSPASSSGGASRSGSFLNSSTDAPAASGLSAAIDHLFGVTQESDVASTLFPRRRARWGQS